MSRDKSYLLTSLHTFTCINKNVPCRFGIVLRCISTCLSQTTCSSLVVLHGMQYELMLSSSTLLRRLIYILKTFFIQNNNICLFRLDAFTYAFFFENHIHECRAASLRFIELYRVFAHMMKFVWSLGVSKRERVIWNKFPNLLLDYFIDILDKLWSLFHSFLEFVELFFIRVFCYSTYLFLYVRKSIKTSIWGISFSSTSGIVGSVCSVHSRRLVNR